MNLSLYAQIATICSFVLFTILTIIDRWPKVAQWGGPMIFKISIAILVIGIISAGIAFYASRQSEISKNWNSIKKVAIVDKTFAHQRVLLDGNSYSNCKFIGVTLVYNGTAPFDLSHNKFTLPIVVASDKPQIEAFIITLRELGFMRPDIQTINKDNPPIPTTFNESKK